MRNGTSSYNFDQIGNRTSVTTPDAPNSLFYLTNALNQYQAIEESVPPSVPVRVHDDDGNLTDDGKGTTFEWNAENRMVEIRDYDENPVDGSVRILNTFDSQGRRVRKQVFDNGTPDKDFRYFYDSWNLIYEIDILATNPEPTYYVWGLDLSQSLQGAGGVGGLLMVLEATNAWAPTYDTNGNISEYINLANGDIDAHLEYDAFGRIIASTGTAPSNFGFSTKYEDVETGYLYYGFRFYDPVTGRWPNRDPIEERGGVNVYGFVGNDGFNYYDILGLQANCCGGQPLAAGQNCCNNRWDYNPNNQCCTLVGVANFSMDDFGNRCCPTEIIRRTREIVDMRRRANNIQRVTRRICRNRENQIDPRRFFDPPIRIGEPPLPPIPPRRDPFRQFRGSLEYPFMDSFNWDPNIPTAVQYMDFQRISRPYNYPLPLGEPGEIPRPDMTIREAEGREYTRMVKEINNQTTGEFFGPKYSGPAGAVGVAKDFIKDIMDYFK